MVLRNDSAFLRLSLPVLALLSDFSGGSVCRVNAVVGRGALGCPSKAFLRWPAVLSTATSAPLVTDPFKAGGRPIRLNSCHRVCWLRPVAAGGPAVVARPH